MSVAIVVLETLAIPYTYPAPVNQSGFGGDWGNSQVTTHIEVPEGLDPTCIMAVQDPTSNVITLQTDPAKVAAKTQAQWVSVRAQQSDLLYKSDWTCSVTDYEPPNKAEWVTYRQALRDVTKQTDPFNIVWPAPPQ